MKITNVTVTLLTGLSYQIIQKYEEADINLISNEILDYLKVDLSDINYTDRVNFKARLRNVLNNLIKAELIDKENKKSIIYKNVVIYKLIKK